MKKLPALVVPDDGYSLIRAFARHTDVSISEAIRQLLKESPRLKAYADEQSINVDEVLTVGEWGGKRNPESEG